MTDFDLLFQSTPATTGDLVFGEVGEGPGNVAVSITGQFAPLTVSAQLVKVFPVQITGSFQGLQVSASLNYDTNTQRPTVGRLEAFSNPGTRVKVGVENKQQDGVDTVIGWENAWALGSGVQNGPEHVCDYSFNTMKESVTPSHQEATPSHAKRDFDYEEAARSVREVIETAFQRATGHQEDSVFRHQDGDRSKRGHLKHKSQEARPLLAGRYSRFQPATPSFRNWISKYQEARVPPPGIRRDPTVEPPEDPCYLPDPTLLFSWPWGYNGTNLVFQCGDYSTGVEPPKATVVVPVLKVYIVLNSVTLVRVSDGAVIPTKSLSLSLDAASWAWSFDASLPMSAQALVEPTTQNVEVLATVNGVSFRLIVESISRERTFGSNNLRIAGRGRNAILDAPYSPSMAFRNTIDRTAQQLAGDALLYNGVPIGWDVDWGLTDWLVPEGVFNHQGTHISALNAIAQAAGGYLQPHRTGTTLRILPKYPSAPWEWATINPDFELPADVTTRESISWTSKVEYNRVFVSGQQAGVMCQVTRAGTAGDLFAPMVTDALITEAAAGRQRGKAILSDTGRIATVGLSLPVLPATGVIEPGKFVRYVDGGTTRLGIVRSTNVSVGATAVDTRQSISLEVHE